MDVIAKFVKSRRKQLKLTQEELAIKAGVALTVIRKIEQGKDNLSLSKVTLFQLGLMGFFMPKFTFFNGIKSLRLYAFINHT